MSFQLNTSLSNIQNRNQAQLSFGRAPNKEELPEFKQDLKEGLDALGKEKIVLIAHGPSFPSRQRENAGVGSPYSDGALDLMKLISIYQFNGIQFGPDGELIKGYNNNGKVIGGNPSPYDSKTFAGNTLFINVSKLATKKWGNILSPETLEKAKVKSDSSDLDTKADCNFKHAFTMYDEALHEAWDNFKAKRAAGDTTITQIDTKFQTYKSQNSDWLEKEAIYDTLVKEHADDPNVKANYNNAKFWNDGIDKNLFGNLDSSDPKVKQDAEQRKQELNNKDDVEFFKFSQFVLDEMKNQRKMQADKLGIKTMADKKVAFSDADVWANQDAFLTDWKLGVPPDYFSKTGQAWNFPVLNPDKMFEKDTQGERTLGPAGKLLFQTFDKMFKDNPGGVRIDHIVGLIDPFVYPDGKNPLDPSAGRLYSSPDNPKLAKWSKIDIDDIDTSADPLGPNRIKEDTFKRYPEKLEKYTEVLEHIILPAAEKNGVEKSNIICEDLGILTRPIAPVMEKLELSGIRVTEFEDPNNPTDTNRASNIAENYWAAAGTHDNNSLISWTEDEVFGDTKSKKANVKTLAEDLKPANPKQFQQKIAADPKEFMKAKVAALFASPAKNIQIFWADLFGIKDRYNQPGTQPEDNWKLRMNSQFRDLFYRNLEQDKGINMPEVMKMALESKHDDKFKPIISKLDHWAQVLKEKEPDSTQK